VLVAEKVYCYVKTLTRVTHSLDGSDVGCHCSPSRDGCPHACNRGCNLCNHGHGRGHGHGHEDEGEEEKIHLCGAVCAMNMGIASSRLMTVWTTMVSKLNAGDFDTQVE
jgi:hypothetical protein